VVISSEAEDLTAVCNRVLIHTDGSGMVTADTGSATPLLEQVYLSQSAARSVA
jgi:ABC-type sugar transport system ATPase subunit